jgi:hypothetical protein
MHLDKTQLQARNIFGVFASDQLPELIEKYPCGFVVNTDPSNQSGTHWLAFYFPSEHKGDSLTVTETHLIIITIHLNITWINNLLNGTLTSVNYRVIGRTCVDNIVYFI